MGRKKVIARVVPAKMVASSRRYRFWLVRSGDLNAQLVAVPTYNVSPAAFVNSCRENEPLRSLAQRLAEHFQRYGMSKDAAYLRRKFSA